MKLNKLFKVYEKNDKIDFHFQLNILDEEGDLINCSFFYDGCATIDTEKLSYLTLSTWNLITIHNAIVKSEKKYRKHFEQDKN